MKIQTIVGHFDSNTFIAECEEGVVLLVDAGAKPDDVQKALNGRKPDAILLTHEHFDHVYHLGAYKKHFNCPVHTPTDEQQISIRGVKIKPYLCPGHSPQSVVYLIKDCLFTGDVLFSDTIGRTDLMKNGDALMQQSLRKLLNVKFTTAYHGHYESSDYEQQQKNINNFL
jgi:glyoxylase-like metal-dependent hydrolase (beta-lactamase superfamily II)